MPSPGYSFGSYAVETDEGVDLEEVLFEQAVLDTRKRSRPGITAATAVETSGTGFCISAALAATSTRQFYLVSAALGGRPSETPSPPGCRIRQPARWLGSRPFRTGSGGPGLDYEPRKIVAADEMS
jgi:hypothetical protein